MTAITTANVFEAFDQAADRYDLMVGLNPGYHDHLRTAAEALAERLPRPVRVQRRRGAAGRPRLWLGRLDSGAAQRDPGARRPRPRWWGSTPRPACSSRPGQVLAAGVSFEIGLAEELAFARESWGLGDRVPGVFAAYLFRNVTERDKVLAAVFDLLDDDGTFVVQEYSVSGSRLAALVWSLVCWAWSSRWAG